MERKKIFYALNVITICLFFSGCHIDFGMKAKDFVQKDLPGLSQDLIQRDIKVRFFTVYEDGLEEVNHRINIATKGVERILKVIDNFKDKRRELNDEKEKGIQDIIFIKNSIPLIIELKRQIEIIDERISLLDGLCDQNYLKNTEIPALSLTLPFQSFQRTQEVVNKLKANLKLGAYYNASTENISGGHADAGGIEPGIAGGISAATAATVVVATNIFLPGAAAASSEIIFSTVASGVYATLNFASYLLVKDKLKKQKKYLREAIESIPTHIYPFDKVVDEAIIECQTQQNNFSKILDLLKSRRGELLSSWGSIYEIHREFYHASQKSFFSSVISEMMMSGLNDDDLRSFDDSHIYSVMLIKRDYLKAIQNLRQAEQQKDPNKKIAMILDSQRELLRLKKVYNALSQKYKKTNADSFLQNNVNKILSGIELNLVNINNGQYDE